MNKSLSKILVIGIALSLLVYTAYRSYHFISMTLPADSQWLGVFALAALDGGLVAWLLVFRSGASGGTQRAVSMGMTVVDLLGATVLAAVDAIMTTGDTGLTKGLNQDQVFYAVLALSLMIVLNVAALVFFELSDPVVKKRGAEEEAKSKIEDMAVAHVDEAADRLAAELAPQIAQHWAADMRSRYQANLDIFGEKKDKKYKELVTSTPPTPKSSENTKDMDGQPPLPVKTETEIIPNPKRNGILSLPKLNLKQKPKEVLEMAVPENGNGNHKSVVE